MKRTKQTKSCYIISYQRGQQLASFDQLKLVCQGQFGSSTESNTDMSQHHFTILSSTYIHIIINIMFRKHLSTFINIYINTYQYSSGWWLGHPSEKYEFVNWDDFSNPIFLGRETLMATIHHQPEFIQHFSTAHELSTAASLRKLQTPPRGRVLAGSTGSGLHPDGSVPFRSQQWILM